MKNSMGMCCVVAMLSAAQKPLAATLPSPPQATARAPCQVGIFQHALVVQDRLRPADSRSVLRAHIAGGGQHGGDGCGGAC